MSPDGRAAFKLTCRLEKIAELYKKDPSRVNIIIGNPYDDKVSFSLEKAMAEAYIQFANTNGVTELNDMKTIRTRSAGHISSERDMFGMPDSDERLNTLLWGFALNIGDKGSNIQVSFLSGNTNYERNNTIPSMPDNRILIRTDQKKLVKYLNDYLEKPIILKPRDNDQSGSGHYW